MTRSAPPSEVRGWTGEDGGLRDSARRDVRTGKRKKKGERNETGGVAGEEMPGWEKKRGNEEIFALSRACHAVLREKTFLSHFFFLFLPLFPL